MIYKLSIWWKSLFDKKTTLFALWEIICSAVGLISSCYAFADLINEMCGFNILKSKIKAHYVIFILIFIVISIFINRKKITYCKKVSNSDMTILISVKDIFDNNEANNSFIIPTNTFFRTKLEREYISLNSVQGRFQQKYFKNDTDGILDKLIFDSLKSQNIPYTDEVDCFGNVKKYPIGTVSKIDYNCKHFYFVALNDVNENGTPINQNIGNIDIALKAILNAIKNNGHCGVLCIPLIGSGRAAIQYATKEAVFQKTINFFIESEYKIAEKLIISINPKDYIENRIDFDRFEKYLDYKCEFR